MTDFPSPIVYLEIPAPNIEKAGSFYSSVFGWIIERSNLSGYEYWMFNTGENSLTGALDSNKPVLAGGVIIYLKVDDIKATLPKCIFRQSFFLVGNCQSKYF